jgi:hypothetical protein
MQAKPLKPRKALNKAFLKVKPVRTEHLDFEAQSDMMVYGLYGLTEEEIEIIENSGRT